MPTVLISIIDDDPWARQGLQDLVTSLGYENLGFASAEAFLASGSMEKSTCVISDVQMPGLSGLDLQKRLAGRANRPTVILVTAYPDEDVKRRAIDAGALAYLTKPLDESCLINCLACAVRTTPIPPDRS
jgi:FixJ family two-component response regulator